MWLSPQDTGLANALPLAVVDRDTPSAPIAADPSLWQHVGQAGRDALLLVRLWVGSMTGNEVGEQTTWLHSNHLGAPELATDRQGQVIWQARYSPFGAAQVEAKTGQGPAFVLHLRLPGQVFDPETGLHYNRARYYDPQAGQYLTPDPLGHPDGPNPYAYVAFNPLSNIDPDGLILFAFDGTNNNLASQTNVQHFARAYADYSSYDTENRIGWQRFYRSGPGTGADDWLDNSVVGGAIAPRLRDIVDVQLGRLNTYVTERTAWEIDKAARSGQRYTKDKPLDIFVDVVGFSRGAAAAREFINRVNEQANQGHYRSITKGACVRVILRFAGLFDTVLSLNTDFNMRMALPDALQYAAHAVALNEHRSLFPLESIESSYRNPGFDSNRIERGFIGGHSDIGGGYVPVDGGDLSDVALNWMVAQAKAQGIRMDPLENAQKTVTSPIVHDERRALQWRALGQMQPTEGLADRQVRYGMASDAPLIPARQRSAPIEGLRHDQTLTMLGPRDLGFGDTLNIKVADVDMVAYRRWLDANYGVKLQ